MSIQQLKELFGNQEAVLELVQLEGGELAACVMQVLRMNPWLKFNLAMKLKAILGEQTQLLLSI